MARRDPTVLSLSSGYGSIAAEVNASLAVIFSPSGPEMGVLFDFN